MKKKTSTILQLWQDYRFNSILVRNFILILAVLLCTLIGIMGLVSWKLDQLVEKETSTISISNLEQTAERMDTVIKEVAQISAQLSMDDNVMGFLLADIEADSPGSAETLKAKKVLEQYAGIFEYIDSVYVYSSKSNYIVTEEGGGSIDEFQDLSWYENFTERVYEPARMISRLKYGKYPYLITYLLPIRLTQMQFMGGIIVNVAVDQIGEFTSSGDGEALLIVDARGNIIFSSAEEYRMKKWQQLGLGKRTDLQDGQTVTVKDGKRQMVLSAMESPDFGWKYISFVPLDKYQVYQDDLYRFMLGMSVLAVVLATAAAIFLSVYSYRPVRSIISLLKNPEHYDPKEIGGFRKDETHEILRNIVHNFYSNSQMQAELKDYLEITNQAQITALQAQISPHFLYNTLENIRWRAIAICKGDNEVSDSILILSELLRISLDNQRQIISVKEEIENAKLYVEILQLRYENKLEIAWDVQKDILETQIVKVSLQPLIENAVYHGIKPMRGKGYIRVRGWRQEAMVYLSIEDNGMGIPAEECALLNRDMQEKYVQKPGHIGIRNVNQRLKLLMGDEAGIMVESVPGAGTKVTMHFLWCEAEEERG